MIVYRVQDKDGRGPWKPGFSAKWVDDEKDFENLIPWPNQFGFGILRKSIIGMSVGCGCVSIEQLRLWFSPVEYRKLREFGYSAVKMAADNILAQSDIQCVFDRIKPLNEGIEPIELYTA